ncbi:BLUF domain-containing protein [Leisingera sp. ANG-Vp]|uniref:BLUF domain-containing protein n=1 Tax=Leisingera sp. ANG-Vp TaxID=1577896 RepID=UPI00057CF820|nr:BLUF domain-containing protein [Leisingera sp. ANG-Vp]KIC15876.1 hypothetical protein RA20_17675 [Leisingera sp. ANG-Vp]
MNRLTLKATAAAGLSHQDIGKFINATRPHCRRGGVTGLMIREEDAVHFLLEGPEAELQEVTSRIRASGLFGQVLTAGEMPIRFRAFDRICLAYAKPGNLPEDMRREITMLTGLEFGLGSGLTFEQEFGPPALAA